MSDRSGYYIEHAMCPRCGCDDYEQTCAGTVLFEKFGDTNRVSCSCGWCGIVNDLVSKASVVRALNAHDDLVAALKDAKEAILNLYDHGDWRNGNTHPDNPSGVDEGAAMTANYVDGVGRKIDAALAKAEGHDA